MMQFEKGKTIGIFGMKGTGKTYLTRELIESLPKDCIVFDTISALKPKNVKLYKIDPHEQFNKQIQVFSGITQKTHKNIGIDLSGCTKAEIVNFTDKYLRITPLSNKYIFIDEAADYIPQTGYFSSELERLIRHGRNAGVTFIFNTQRPAYITKDVLNLVDIPVFFRLVWERDIIVIKDLLNHLAVENLDEEIQAIAAQQVGEYKVFYLGSKLKE